MSDTEEVPKRFLWYQLKDPTSGKPFFANEYTGQCTWEQPIGVTYVADCGRYICCRVKAKPLWREMWDPQAKQPYYMNSETGDFSMEAREWERDGTKVFPIPMSYDDDKHLRNALADGQGTTNRN